MSRSPHNASEERGSTAALCSPASRQNLAARVAELSQQVRPRLLVAARKRIGTQLQARLSAEEVADETLDAVRQAVLESRPHLVDDLDKFRSYAVTALQNCIKDKRVHHERLCRDVRREAHGHDGGGGVVDPAAPSSRSPSRGLIKQEDAHAVRSGLGELSPSDRCIVWERAGNKRPFQEIARLLGLSTDAARKRFGRTWPRFLRRILRRVAP